MNLYRTVTSAMLVALALLLYNISVKLPMLPPFLKYDPSDVPLVVGSINFGPVTGLLLQLVKNVLHVLMRGGNWIGGLANFTAGALLVGATAFAYRALAPRLRWTAILIGAVVMAIGMLITNTYFFLPARGMLAEKAVQTAVFALTPFNLVKGVINAGLGVLLFERIGAMVPGLRPVERPTLPSVK